MTIRRGSRKPSKTEKGYYDKKGKGRETAPVLDDEDEKILDKIWADIAKKHKRRKKDK